MFTQFFGNYLLNNKIITVKQLAEALELKNTTRVKLGVLAINAGFMNSDQVERVHTRQMQEDKRFGDLAVEMGYLSESQVMQLLGTQKTGYLLLGQALVDKGYMSNMQFENSLNAYKALYSLDDDDFSAEQSDKITNVISSFYSFDRSENGDALAEYISLLFKNLVRFIGDDFTPLAVDTDIPDCSVTAKQSITGGVAMTTAIEGGNALEMFATRFSGEAVNGNNELIFACISEFLNLHNGLYAVNMSNSRDIELQLTPQEIIDGCAFVRGNKTFFIPVEFSFGPVTFIIAE